MKRGFDKERQEASFSEVDETFCNPWYGNKTLADVLDGPRLAYDEASDEKVVTRQLRSHSVKRFDNPMQVHVTSKLSTGRKQRLGWVTFVCDTGSTYYDRLFVIKKSQIYKAGGANGVLTDRGVLRERAFHVAFKPGRSIVSDKFSQVVTSECVFTHPDLGLCCRAFHYPVMKRLANARPPCFMTDQNLEGSSSKDCFLHAVVCALNGRFAEVTCEESLVRCLKAHLLVHEEEFAESDGLWLCLANDKTQNGPSDDRNKQGPSDDEKKQGRSDDDLNRRAAVKERRVREVNKLTELDWSAFSMDKQQMRLRIHAIASLFGRVVIFSASGTLCYPSAISDTSRSYDPETDALLSKTDVLLALHPSHDTNCVRHVDPCFVQPTTVSAVDGQDEDEVCHGYNNEEGKGKGTGKRFCYCDKKADDEEYLMCSGRQCYLNGWIHTKCEGKGVVASELSDTWKCRVCASIISHTENASTQLFCHCGKPDDGQVYIECSGGISCPSNAWVHRTCDSRCPRQETKGKKGGRNDVGDDDDDDDYDDDGDKEDENQKWFCSKCIDLTTMDDKL
jgi:hypothetical protein